MIGSRGLQWNLISLDGPQRHLYAQCLGTWQAKIFAQSQRCFCWKRGKSANCEASLISCSRNWKFRSEPCCCRDLGFLNLQYLHDLTCTYSCSNPGHPGFFAVRSAQPRCHGSRKIAALCIRLQDGLWFNRFKLSVVEPVSTSKSFNNFQQAIGAFCQHFMICWGWLEQMAWTVPAIYIFLAAQWHFMHSWPTCQLDPITTRSN